MRELADPEISRALHSPLRVARAHAKSLKWRSMHESSLAQLIVEQATEAARRANAERVVSVQLRVGRLAGVEPGALLFCYDVAARGTLLEGSRLKIVDVPLVVWCAHCLKEVELPGVQRFRCPSCDTPCGEIRQGREMEIASLEIAS